VKRSAWDHPKLCDLEAALGVPRWGAVGILESLWMFTGKFAPHGNIGKHSDVAIARFLGWTDPPGRLIDALMTAGWVDADDVERLVVHDWHEHCDEATRKHLSRQRNEHSGGQLRKCPDGVRTVSGQMPKVSVLPEPEPEPEPVKKKTWSSTPMTDCAFDAFWHQYPRKVAKVIARKAWQKLNPDSPTTESLMAALAVACRSRQWQRDGGEFVPHPATWLNQRRWEDAPAGSNGTEAPSPWDQPPLYVDCPICHDAHRNWPPDQRETCPKEAPP